MLVVLLSRLIWVSSSECCVLQSNLAAQSAELSRPMALIVLDAVVGKTCAALDALFTKSMVSVTPYVFGVFCGIDTCYW